MSRHDARMLPRERVFAALEFKAPDVVPLEYHPSPAGCYEHGTGLRRLWEEHPGDFGDARDFPDARPDPRWIGPDGRYCEMRRDEWGVLWRHLIFGIAGHPAERPLDDWAGLARFRTPALPADSGPEFDRERARAAEHRRKFFLKSGWISIFEVMHAVRRFEDVLMDIASDTPEAHLLADLIETYQAGYIRYLLRRGADAIQFGDDFGTQSSLMMDPRTWRHFFKPRYARLVRQVREAGKKVFFHTCGNATTLLPDFAELGLDAIWPQLNAYDEEELAAFCRSSKIAVALHPDRGGLMTAGGPEDVRRAVERLAGTFRVAEGGAWFYVEIDAGFPLENVRALIETVGRMRAPQDPLCKIE